MFKASRIGFTLAVMTGLLLCGCTTTQQAIKATGPVSSAPVVAKPESNIDENIDELAQQVSQGMTAKGKTKIAVIEFTDLQGNITNFGKYLAEELITRLFETGKFRVIERNLLNKVIEEQKLTLTQLIDPSSVQKLGRILGVDAIVSGTITDLGEKLKVNARIIGTETGDVFAVASTGISKDETVMNLMRMGDEKRNRKTKKEYGSELVFYEDFSSIEEGLVPPDWLGTEHVMVRSSREKKYLTNFEKGYYRIVIPNIIFPDNFKIEWYATYRPGEGTINASFDLTLGNLTARMTDVGNYALINNTSVQINRLSGKTLIVALEKKDDLFRLFIDGAQIVFVRFPNFQANSIVIDFEGNPFNLYKISVTAL